MADDPLFLTVAFAAFVVLGILLFGVGTFAKGGAFNRKHANKIMRARVVAQFVAVLIAIAFVALRSSGN